MGACECENPMEFGYEVNTTEKDEKTTTNNNKYKQTNPNISDNNEKNSNNLVNLESNINDSSREKRVENSDNIIKPKNYNIYNSNSQSYQRQQYNKGNMEGVNALRARYENQSKNNDNNFNYEENLHLLNNAEKPLDKFSQYIFENINSIRENPQSFIPIIEKAKSHIMFDKKGTCIYKSSVKVALSRGEPAFDEAIDYLRNLQPMNRLIFSPDLVIIPPNNEDELKDRKYMNEKINEKVQIGIPIKSFWRDIIKDDETCLILMIVDDTGANSGKKRNDILDPSMQGIGIASRMVGKTFASYVTLC